MVICEISLCLGYVACDYWLITYQSFYLTTCIYVTIGYIQCLQQGFGGDFYGHNFETAWAILFFNKPRRDFASKKLSTPNLIKICSSVWSLEIPHTNEHCFSISPVRRISLALLARSVRINVPGFILKCVQTRYLRVSINLNILLGYYKNNFKYTSMFDGYQIKHCVFSTTDIIKLNILKVIAEKQLLT